MIPLQEMSARRLTRRLKELVDDVVDPETRFRNPELFAQSYADLCFLLDHYSNMLALPYVKHNVGSRRLAYIDMILLGRESA